MIKSRIKYKIFVFMMLAVTNGQYALIAQESLPPVKEAKIDALPDAYAIALKQVIASLNSFRSLQSDFRLIGTNGQSLNGTVSLKKPGHIRFDFGEQANQLYVADGKTLSIIDYEIGKVEKVPVKDTPLSVLLSNEIKLKKFKTRIVINPDGIGSAALVVEDPDRPEMGVLTLVFKKDTQNIDQLLVDYWTMRDSQGHLTYVMLENIQKDIPLGDQLWRYEDPRGAAKRRR